MSAFVLLTDGWTFFASREVLLQKATAEGHPGPIGPAGEPGYIQLLVLPDAVRCCALQIGSQTDFGHIVTAVVELNAFQLQAQRYIAAASAQAISRQSCTAGAQVLYASSLLRCSTTRLRVSLTLTCAGCVVLDDDLFWFSRVYLVPLVTANAVIFGFSRKLRPHTEPPG